MARQILLESIRDAWPTDRHRLMSYRLVDRLPGFGLARREWLAEQSSAEIQAEFRCRDPRKQVFELPVALQRCRADCVLRPVFQSSGFSPPVFLSPVLGRSS